MKKGNNQVVKVEILPSHQSQREVSFLTMKTHICKIGMRKERRER